MGQRLRIDLSRKKFVIDQIPLDWYEQFIGGEGFAAKTLYDEIKPGLDPLSEENILVFALGSLTGTRAPASGRLCIGFKSPLSGALGMSNVGGFLGPMIKRAGYDIVIIEGKSDVPVYLSIVNDTVEFKDASDLWGLDTEKTEDSIRQALGNDKVRIAGIGPAGENLVKFSSIMIDKHRAAGRGGAGAVMGSKNLKALAFFGEKIFEDAVPQMMDLYSKKAREELEAEEFVREELKPFGTPSFTDSINALGLLPTRNWQFTTFDAMDKIGHQAYHETLEVKPWPCFGCPIACGRHTTIKEGKYKGESGGGPEYETLGAFGSKCFIDDLNAITMANYLCNRMGMDTISTGQVIATAMEWYEKGLIDQETTDGIPLEFGNADALVTMVEKIARREGYGHVLAEGSIKAAEQLGEEAKKYTFTVKGVELASCGVRASKGETLSHVISPRGADHLRPYASVIDAFGYLEPELGITEKASPFEDGNKSWVKPFMALSMLTNLLGVCLFNSITLAVKGSTWTGLYNAATGEESTLEALLTGAERVINLERMFNYREGFDIKDDQLPVRLTTEPAPDGLGKGNVVDTEVMLREFYQSMGWNLETGIPTEATLKSLGIQ
ncbi:MAG: hypothetical protein AVO33_01015 [delta proteobacterium ML8_F1]|nr:MAG: hypothetical protein AVO33_01015 [delta proteobacterium ML8_F1]